MPFSMLRLKPGVNTEQTPSQVEAGIVSANLIRHRQGLPEKLGGWDKYYPFALLGVPKALHAWQDLNDNRYLGIGTTGALTRLFALNEGTLTDITPQELTSNFTPNGSTRGFTTTNGSANVTVLDTNTNNITAFDAVIFNTPVAVGGLILHGAYKVALALGGTSYRIVAASNATSSVTAGGAVPTFTTTNGSANVTVGLVAHGLVAGASINFPLSTTVGGVTIFDTYEVASVLTADTFTINASTQATASAGPTSMNSGQVQLHYLITLGPGGSSSGYGIGTYGSGGYGTGSPMGSQAGSPIDADDWTLDNWGQILVTTPEDGAIWSWQPLSGFNNAQIIAGNDAPVYNHGSFIAAEQQILVCYGSTTLLDIGIDQDPMLVRWSNQGDYTDFVSGVAGSQAGERRLSNGSRIVAGIAAPQFNLLWTDIGLWTMSYIGVPGVFGFHPIGSGCGAIAKHAVTRLGANVYWMGLANFFALAGGAPVPMPCTVWDYVYQDLNQSARDRCFAWANTPFNEVFFFFPRESTGATEPDAYVKFNVLEGVWDPGVLARSAGIDASILGQPIAAASDGLIYEHEVSPDADGQALEATFTTGLYQLGDGEEMMFVDWLLPDMRWQNFNDAQGAQVQITIYAYEYLSSTPITHGPFTVTQATPFINCRIRGRFLSLKISSNDVGSFWRVGGTRFRLAMSGRR